MQCLIVYPSVTDLLVLDSPTVLAIYKAKKILHLRINASYFELTGWEADKRIYSGDFNPNVGGWSNKSKGEVMIKFEGEDKRTKCSIKLLLDHNLTVIADEDDGDASDDSSPPQTPENAPQPGAIDPNRTQTFGDSSDDEEPEEGTCMHRPPLFCSSPLVQLLRLTHLRFLHACRLGTGRFWTRSRRHSRSPT